SKQRACRSRTCTSTRCPTASWATAPSAPASAPPPTRSTPQPRHSSPTPSNPAFCDQDCAPGAQSRTEIATKASHLVRSLATGLLQEVADCYAEGYGAQAYGGADCDVHGCAAGVTVCRQALALEHPR